MAAKSEQSPRDTPPSTSESGEDQLSAALAALRTDLYRLLRDELRAELVERTQEQIAKSVGSYSEDLATVEASITERADAAEERYKGLQSVADQAAAQISKSSEEARRSIDDHQGVIGELGRSIDSLRAESESKLGDIREQIADIQATTEKYVREESTKHGREFWDTKRQLHWDQHLDWSKRTLWSTILGAAGLLLLWFLLLFLAPSQFGTSSSGGDGTTVGAFISNYWKTAVVLLTAGVYFGTIRVLARMMMSERHLANDAAERVAMIDTYVAFGELEGVKDEQKQLMLQALFRNATSGLIKEEAVPPSVLDLASRMAGGGGSKGGG